MRPGESERICCGFLAVALTALVWGVCWPSLLQGWDATRYGVCCNRWYLPYGLSSLAMWIAATVGVTYLAAVLWSVVLMGRAGR